MIAALVAAALAGIVAGAYSYRGGLEEGLHPMTNYHYALFYFGLAVGIALGGLVVLALGA